MSDSTNLQLPYLEGAQAQKHVTVNEGLRKLDAFVFLAAEDKDLSAPPGSPADGARYIPKATATGAWSGKENHIAHYVDGAWEFYSPREGWQAYVKDEDIVYCYSGSAWVSILTAGLDADLQAIAALTPTNDDLVQRKSGAWTNRTMAQLLADLMPAAASFSAYLSSSTSNDKTGDGTLYAVICDTEEFDSGGNFASGVFTAPATGKYAFIFQLIVTNLSASHTASSLYLVTSDGRTFQRGGFNPHALSDASGNAGLNIAVDIALTAGQTVTPKIGVFSGTKTVGVMASGNRLTFFSGKRISG